MWPNDILVELFVERLGNSSVTIGHRIVDQHDASKLYSDGNVVVVWMDTQTGKSARCRRRSAPPLDAPVVPTLVGTLCCNEVAGQRRLPIPFNGLT